MSNKLGFYLHFSDDAKFGLSSLVEDQTAGDPDPHGHQER